MTDTKTTPSAHHVIVMSNTVLPYDHPFSIRCITCEPTLRKGFQTLAYAEAYAEGHRQQYPLVVDAEAMAQRLASLERSLLGLSLFQIAEFLDVITSYIRTHTIMRGGDA